MSVPIVPITFIEKVVAEKKIEKLSKICISLQNNRETNRDNRDTISVPNPLYPELCDTKTGKKTDEKQQRELSDIYPQLLDDNTRAFTSRLCALYDFSYDLSGIKKLEIFYRQVGLDVWTVIRDGFRGDRATSYPCGLRFAGTSGDFHRPGAVLGYEYSDEGTEDRV